MSMLRCFHNAARAGAPFGARRHRVASAGPNASEKGGTTWRKGLKQGKQGAQGVSTTFRPVVCLGCAWQIEALPPNTSTCKTFRCWTTVQDAAEKYRFQLSSIADTDALTRSDRVTFVECGIGFTFCWWNGIPLVFKGLSPDAKVPVSGGREYGAFFMSVTALDVGNSRLQMLSFFPGTGFRLGVRHFSSGLMSPVGLQRRKARFWSNLTGPFQMTVLILSPLVLVVMLVSLVGGLAGKLYIEGIGKDDPEFIRDYQKLQTEFRRHQTLGNEAVAGHIMKKMYEMQALKAGNGELSEQDRLVLLSLSKNLEEPDSDRFRLLFGMKTDKPLWLTEEDAKPDETPADAIIRRAKQLQMKLDAEKVSHR